ncbi:MAG: sugar kinase [Homoserinimonas sp.]
MPSHARHRIITLGETMVLVTPASSRSLEEAQDFHLDIGGAESNVATHLAALGHEASWVSRVGDDSLGRRLVATIRERGVDTSMVDVTADAPTGVYFKDPGAGVLYYRRGSAASTLGPSILDQLPLLDAELVHISGITPALSPSCGALIDALFDRLEQTSTQVSFDVNYRGGLWSVADAASRLHHLAQRADIVFVGLDEAETLWSTRTPDEVRAILHAPGRLVVKDSDVGATEYSANGEAFVPALTVDVVEPVGAGDAFAAGYLAAALDGSESSERLTAGHQRAALVLQSMSDFVADDRHDEGQNS